ncbi:triple functional domain protein [Paragonimus westermani]|uniref:Triple functional domain protein n=1 Tax=Paragonimus westermani TaxID=34504 RepID=A0A5J4P0M2_9TREM|nr:triple functional domain protein [Paragonimus westermani]
MNFNSNNLDPEVLEFYYPNRSKNARCRAYHAHPQQTQRIHSTHPGAQQQVFQVPFKHVHSACTSSGNYSGATTSGKALHEHTLAQQHMGSSEHFHHHPGQRYRSSASPVQALSSACGSSASTLNSSSGYCTVSSVPHANVHGSLRAIDIIKLLREKIALLPGGRSRRGGPILCFPANTRADEIPFEELYVLVLYLAYLPEDRVKKLGFSVIIDMRNGTTWHSVKPILKVVEKCISRNVAMAYIIKPDKIIEKHKTSMAIGKFSFEIQIVSLDTLFREVDPSQLTAELEGSLPYNHEEWIKIRCCLEEFFCSAHDMADKFGHLFYQLERKQELDTVEAAKRALEEHRFLRLKLAPQVRQTVVKLYEYRAHLQQKWEAGRSRFEQVHQLRIFEDDVNRMATWLGQQRHLFLTEYLDIGQTASHASDLLTEHRQFVDSCYVAFDQIARLNVVAGMLADVGHFASQQILKQAGQLEHEWKSFAAAFEDRSRVLYLSASFHARAQAFLANCPQRDKAMRQCSGTTVHELHQALLTLQNYWQEAQSAREEVCEDGRALINHLSAPVPSGSHTSLTAAVDYSQGRKHCTELVHEIWAWFKQLERVYTERKSHLNSNLAMLMFKEDVGHVLSWLSEHGEPFLQRQTSVGKSSLRAEQLYNTHMQFEQVAAKTLLNAEKLLSVADELAAHADDPEDLLQRASELQRRIAAFTRAIETRRETVDLGCGFYSHTKKVLSWLSGFRDGHNPGEHLPASIEGMEDEITNFHRDRSEMEEEADRVTTEGEALISRLKDPDEVAHIRSVLVQVSNERATVSNLLTERQVRLDLCLQLRLFEADVNSALDRLRQTVPSLATLMANRSDTSPTPSSTASNLYAWFSDPRQAPDLSSLEEVSSICLSVLPIAEEVLHKGGELVRAFESLGVNFPAGGPGSSDSGVGDSIESAVERVLNWISQCEDILRETAIIPANLAEAQALQTEHEKFQPVLNDAHPQAVQCTARATMLLQQTANASGGGLSSSTAGTEHPRRKDYRAIAEAVADHWQKLVYAAEDRHKLLITAANWYKTSEQVSSVLWSLEKEYNREEDWCQNVKAGVDVSAYLNQLSVKHAEQKEAFLKACMLARRTSDVFSRYLHRQSPTTTGRTEVEEKIRKAMSELMAKEQAVLEAWAVRRRRVDDCTYFVNIKRQVEELLTRVHNQSHTPNSPSKGPVTLTASTQLGSSLIQEVRRACESLESMITASMPLSPGHTSQLQALLKHLQASLPQQTADTSAKTSTNAAGSDVGTPYPSQTTMVNQRKPTGMSMVSSRLDIPASRIKRPDVDTDRTSVSSTSSSGTGSTGTGASDMFLVSAAGAATTGPTQEQRRMIRRRENLLHELIQTERTYIQALEQCLDLYRKSLISPPQFLEGKVPAGLVGMTDVIFGNIPAIYQFHKHTFEPELGKYTESGDFLPEDVGHCFVVHSERLAELYVEYCVNYTESTRIVIEHGQNYFQAVQQHFNLTEPLPSYLIKPVQRVTKYQLLLRELRDCCDPASVAELNEGLEAMLGVPKRANDALHMSMLQCLPEDLSISTLGDVILQDQFTVWEPKQLIKKSRERRVFLFDNCLILAKETQTQPGEHKVKYHYKSRLLLAECNITEHIEGDQCKFALWTGRVPSVNEYRMVLKASSLELKQTWVRALRELMRERMFSVQGLYQHQQNAGTGRPGMLCDEAELLDTYYILETYQAAKSTELSVSAHQIVQLLHRCDTPHLPPPADAAGDSSASAVYNPNGTGEWAYIRMLVQGAASSTESPIKEGFIPARLIGAPSGRRRRPQSTSTNHQNSSNNSRRSSTAGRKWLPTGSEARRGTGLISNKRGSKADLNQTQVFSTPYPTAAPRVISNEREPPQIMMKPDSVERSPTTATILDNVSEESIDVELPPPMSEIQVIAPKTVEESDVDSPRLGGIDPLRLLDDQSSITSGGVPLKIVETKSSDRPVHSQSNMEPVSDKPSKVSHRPASVAEVAGDGRTGINNSPTLVGLSSGANLSSLGDLRLHGGLSVAAKLVCGSRPSQSGGPSSSSGPDEDMLRGVLEEGAELHFVNRYLFLYDQALVIADAALELLPSSVDDEQSTLCPPRLQCQFRHALPISQISILEDVGVPGSKPTGDQLLWFCLSERARNMISPFDSHLNNPTSSTQSYLCYVVAPRSPDTRVRWLTELTTMVMEARRLSQAFTTMGSSPVESGTFDTGDYSFGVNSKLSNTATAAATALYPGSMLFDPGLLELPRLGRLSSATLTSSPAASKCKTISNSLAAKSSEKPLSNLLEDVHLTATSSS